MRKSKELAEDDQRGSAAEPDQIPLKARNSLTVSLLSPERAFAGHTEGTGSMNSAGFHLNSEGQKEGQGAKKRTSFPSLDSIN